MERENQKRSESPKTDDTMESNGRNRRRLGKAALATAPVLLTLHSNPLLATVAGNCTPSGWVSGNASQGPGLDDCGGRTPGYWQNLNPDASGRPAGWPDNADQPLNSQYGFPCLPIYFNKQGGEATMGDAVAGPGQEPLGLDLNEFSDLRQVLRFGAAALLNAKYPEVTNPPYPLSEQLIRDIVCAVVNYGAYTSGSVTLDLEQAKRFLENTMEVPNWGP